MLSDRIAVMNGGKLEQVGTPREIYLRPKTRFVASFLGAMNWFDDVGVRPELTRIARTRPGNGARCIGATVQGSRFLGNCVHIEGRLANGDAVISEADLADDPMAPGEAVHVWWNASDEVRLPLQ